MEHSAVFPTAASCNHAFTATKTGVIDPRFLCWLPVKLFAWIGLSVGLKLGGKLLLQLLHLRQQPLAQ